QMPATGNTATRGKRKVLITALLLIGLMVGLAACRGFFGQAPIALLTYAPITDEEVPVTVDFDISGSNDPDGNIASYELDYGDGSTAATGTDVTDALSHEYIEAGPFTVTLTVTDGDGRIGMDTKIIATIGPAMITFASDRGGNYGIYRMLADGTGETEVRNTTSDELFPDLVRGTRNKIAYAAEGSAWNISTMTVEGDSLAQLTTQTASNQIQPSWSYNATKIAYASNAAQTPSASTWEIWTMTASGGSQTKLTAQSPSWAIAPAYSPVSDDLLFVSDKNNTTTGTAIWKLHGTTATQLYPATTTHAYHYGDASPDMSAAFATALDLPDGMISKPAWSPDGTKIAFSTDKDTAINIYVMDADGTGVQTLEAYVNSLLSSSVTAASITSGDDEFSPYWLEDETGLVFTREETTGYNIYKVSFDDGSVTKLTDSTDNDIMPAAKR
ncbi:MAG: PKD domain-containing protein, partial [Candidatus Bipolaricaulota bacterium]|nr:PKD domain-containing protein [Candidatus Bipolaricaulota bacterium]